MIFSTYEFLFLFLPIVVVVYFLLSRYLDKKFQHAFLTMASLLFYGYFKPQYLLIIIISILVNYSLATLMKISRVTKVYLFVGILFNIGMLGFYKYTDFVIENINTIFNEDYTLIHILLPLGISFFTFQQFSFLISVHKGEEKVENFIDYCLFVTFFPQLVAGPIVLYSEMIPQFKDENRRKINYSNIVNGCYIFSIGLFKKIVIADTMAIFVMNGYDQIENYGMITAWLTTLSYTFQIYFDFSGYCDMAIGIGKIFNIDLPLNFNQPYKANGIIDFWRRWHITLGRALANYVYIPLGGNRKGKFRTYINLIVTFFISGLWHGASWSFIIWGVLHGLFSMSERIFAKKLKNINNVIRISVTFMIVNFLWVLFRATSIVKAFRMYKGLFNFQYLGLDQIGTLGYDGLINLPPLLDLTYILIMLVICFVFVFVLESHLIKEKDNILTTKMAIVTSLIVLISVIHMSRISPFIYYNF